MAAARATDDDRIAAVAIAPVIRHDPLSLERTRQLLRAIRRGRAVGPMLGVAAAGVLLLGGAAFLLAIKLFPALDTNSHAPNSPMNIAGVVLVATILAGFVGYAVLTPAVEFWARRRLMAQASDVCDPEICGDLVDTLASSSMADAGFIMAPARLLIACLKRVLPEMNEREAATLTGPQRDWLTEKMRTWPRRDPEFVVAVIQAARLLGDIDTFVALLALYHNTEDDRIRAAASENLPILKQRIQNQRSLDTQDLFRALPWPPELTA